MIHIVDYGMGNLGSIQNMLKKLGIASKIAESPDQCSEAEKLILPGVGAFDEGMRVLNLDGWVPFLNQKVKVEKVPILGICLGMQLMTNFSEEGRCDGLKWIDAATVRFDVNEIGLKVPHMGWNVVVPSCETSLFLSQEDELRFYHVHSYFVRLNDSSQELSSTVYGTAFTSAFQNNNILGVQFHPEKSHKFGMQLLKNFYENY